MTQRQHATSVPVGPRIDQPHAVGPALLRGSRLGVVQAAAVAEVANHSGIDLEAPPSTDERIARHAGELAERLAHQVEELDRRAALLDALEVEIDNKLRAARMWIEDRQRELDQREASLDRGEGTPANSAASSDEVEARQRELDSRQADLYRQVVQLTHERAAVGKLRDEVQTSQMRLRQREEELQAKLETIQSAREEQTRVASEFEARHRELNDLADTLAEREQQLAFRQREIETSITRFQRLGVVGERLAEIDEQAATFAARSRHLDEAESQLADDTQQLVAERKRLAADRAQWQESIAAERRRLSAEREAALAERRQREVLLKSRECELDARERALHQLRCELENSQREVLEMRLATEETWAQLAGALAPASLTRSIAQTRAKLADHFQYAIRELTAKRDELDKLRSVLSSEHEDLAQQQQQLRDWAVRREEDLQAQAMRLITREQELDRQQSYYEQQAASWIRERDEYNTRIRKLLAELRTTTLRAAA